MPTAHKRCFGGVNHLCMRANSTADMSAVALRPLVAPSYLVLCIIPDRREDFNKPQRKSQRKMAARGQPFFFVVFFYPTRLANSSISARMMSRLERQKAGVRTSMPKRAARVAASSMPVEERRSS